ncbi:tyrosine-type recombinase/integrase [Haloarcula sp. JP-L23]|uniref:tyrosine-type recombinase/integrase n=1 Tax=Haloarcula sp. JP-L23 TaxID=2716717 RepID=UPI00140F00DF|nr:tyrosine-type recombinase/integrase [Haloarcula sp. JP-L23]
MVADSEKPRIRYENQRETIIDQFTTEDADAILEFLDAYDPNLETPRPPEGDQTKAITTLYNYARDLTKVGECIDTPLTQATADHLNDTFKALYRGTHPEAKDGGYSQNTVRAYQNNTVKFYSYYDGEPVDPDDLFRYSRDQTPVDERDMFTEDEIEAMRDEIEHPRDRAIFELLLNTGQRVSAIQKLRVKDIDVDEGLLYLNHEEGQHKNARGKRPLLGAEQACREWLRYHPTGEPDDYFITQRDDFRGPGKDPGSQLHTTNIWRAVKKIADKAGVEKDANPHAFRHNFATICAGDYDMSPDTIKHLLGHSDSSTTFEEVYKHISDGTYVEKAEVAAGKREEKEEDDRLSPNICHCGQSLPSDAKACHACGTVYAPDAQAAKERLDDDTDEKKDTAEDMDILRAIDRIDRLREENPELLEELGL